MFTSRERIEVFYQGRHIQSSLLLLEQDRHQSKCAKDRRVDCHLKAVLLCFALKLVPMFRLLYAVAGPFFCFFSIQSKPPWQLEWDLLLGRLRYRSNWRTYWVCFFSVLFCFSLKWMTFGAIYFHLMENFKQTGLNYQLVTLYQAYHYMLRRCHPLRVPYCHHRHRRAQF